MHRSSRNQSRSLAAVLLGAAFGVDRSSLFASKVTVPRAPEPPPNPEHDKFRLERAGQRRYQRAFRRATQNCSTRWGKEASDRKHGIAESFDYPA